MSKTSTNIFSGSNMKKVCATCQFWDCDSREIGYQGRVKREIVVDGSYHRDCGCSIARTRIVAHLSSSCPKWKK